MSSHKRNMSESNIININIKCANKNIKKIKINCVINLVDSEDEQTNNKSFENKQIECICLDDDQSEQSEDEQSKDE
jgi:hypothetical protein